jgi:hypothetical protein
VDRDEYLTLKPSCRTICEYGPIGLDPNESRDFILGLLSPFEWLSRLVIMTPPSHCKDFVVFDKDHDLQWTFSDVAQFDAGCTFDAETG